MPVNRQQLNEFNFIHTHDIVMDGDAPTFRRRGDRSPKDASIYMWLSPNPHDATLFDTLYIGKAGYGVERRQSQHKGGFTHSGTGRANRTLITEWLASGRTLQVYARISDFSSIFGEHISLYSAEEAAACEVFEPCWNRANFPQAQRVVVVDRRSEAPALLVTEENISVPGNRPLGVTEGDAEAKIALAFQCVPQGDEVGMFVESLDEDTQNRFLRVMDFLQINWPTATHKIVRGYSSQPTGYSKKPMLVIANVRGSDGKAVDWFARVPLINEDRTPLTIIFHRDLLDQDVEAGWISKGNKGDWRPIDMDHFLDNSGSYLRQ
jgi:hypothetical protein